MRGDISRVVASPHEPGVYYVDRDTWQVGTRYELKNVLGTGSFSAVCLAFDRLEGDKVALKRVGDVFASPENAKRVLREVCIMRRLEHPNIIRLRDVFLKPSPTGKYVFRGGRLVATSFDCYMAMEYCDQGDLFNMRGQLPEHEVRSLMWQLLSALRYLHGLNVWHRDIKTGNLLITLHEGRRLLKVADFGSARSAKDAGQNSAERRGDECQGLLESGPALPVECSDGMELEEGEEEDAAEARLQQGAGDDCGPLDDTAAGGHSSNGTAAAAAGKNCCRSGNGSFERFGPSACRPPRSGGSRSAACVCPGLVAVPAPDGGYRPPLTSLVCTPCYRAPEVVMSRGGYSSAIDMWSAGCVFGELLQRAAYLGKASTPHLQVAPVFAITGKPLTPRAGQRYGVADAGAGGGSVGASAHAELSALFAVIGTPAWACIEAVRSEAWRRFLFHIPGRAPTLHRRFSQAGEVAVDLLARLLQFDPGRRASAEEALAHEYFALLHMEAQMAATGIAPEAEAGFFRAGRARSHLHRRPSSPGAGDDEAAAAGAAKPRAASSAAASPPLPTWPPGRGASQRSSGTGDSAAAAMDIEMESVAACGVLKGMAAAGRGNGGAQVSAAATALPPRRAASARAGSNGGCGSLLTKRKQLEGSGEEEEDGGGAPQRQQAGTGTGTESPRRGAVQRPSGEGGPAGEDGRRLSFWQVDEPALALAALEAELAVVVPPGTPASSDTSLSPRDRSRAATASQSPEALAFVEGCKERLREMLERECAEHAARAAARRGAAAGPERGPGSSGSGSAAAAASGGSSGSGTGGGGGGGVRRARSSDGLLLGPEGQALGGPAGAGALHGHLRPDPGQQLDPSVIGYERIPYHADAAAARLEPEKHLWAGRHGEWTTSSLAQRREAPGAGTWGVTLMPPGLDEDTAAGRAVIDAVRSQQAR